MHAGWVDAQRPVSNTSSSKQLGVLKSKGHGLDSMSTDMIPTDTVRRVYPAESVNVEGDTKSPG